MIVYVAKKEPFDIIEAIPFEMTLHYPKFPTFHWSSWMMGKRREYGDEYEVRRIDNKEAANLLRQSKSPILRAALRQFRDMAVKAKTEPCFRAWYIGEDGKVVKSNDHLQDCLRYLIVSGLIRAITLDLFNDQEQQIEAQSGRNATTGY